MLCTTPGRRSIDAICNTVDLQGLQTRGHKDERAGYSKVGCAGPEGGGVRRCGGSEFGSEMRIRLRVDSWRSRVMAWITTTTCVRPYSEWWLSSSHHYSRPEDEPRESLNAKSGKHMLTRIYPIPILLLAFSILCWPNVSSVSVIRSHERSTVHIPL